MDMQELNQGFITRVQKLEDEQSNISILKGMISASPTPSEVLAGIRQYIRTKALENDIETFHSVLRYINSITNHQEKIYNALTNIGFKLFSSYEDYMVFTKELLSDNLNKSLMLVDLTKDTSISVVITAINKDDFTEIESAFESIHLEKEVIKSAVLSLAADGDVRTQPFTIDDNPNKYPILEFYPEISSVYDSLEDLYEEFLTSPEPIMLLIGSPGTAKTTFIRGLMKYSKKNIGVTYDKKLMQVDPDILFYDTDKFDIFVFEDSDVMLHKRTDGNDQMAKILNVSDGLIPNKNRKMIFSTNLPSVKDVDEAMLRPGRCFGVFDFRRLSQEEAVVVANKLNITNFDSTTQKDWSIGEIAHLRKTRKESKPKILGRMGFY